MIWSRTATNGDEWGRIREGEGEDLEAIHLKRFQHSKKRKNSKVIISSPRLRKQGAKRGGGE